MGNNEASFMVKDKGRMTGELVRKNKLTVVVKFGIKTIKRHIVKHQVQFV